MPMIDDLDRGGKNKRKEADPFEKNVSLINYGTYYCTVNLKSTPADEVYWCFLISTGPGSYLNLADRLAIPRTKNGRLQSLSGCNDE